MIKRDKLYYENRIRLLESRDAAVNRSIINKCRRALRRLMKGSDNVGKENESA